MELTTTGLEQLDVPSLTVAPATKLLPLIVTACPPASAPELGLIPLMLGESFASVVASTSFVFWSAAP